MTHAKSPQKRKRFFSSPVPSTPRTDALMFTLHYAASIATNAIQNLSRRLLMPRGEAATALSGVCALLDRRSLPREMIECAKREVVAWLTGPTA
jgi:hypothetical protein